MHVGENFSSWEERIDYQLAYAHDRIDIRRDIDHSLAARIGETQAAVDSVVRDLRRSQAQVHTRIAWMWVAIGSLTLAVLTLLIFGLVQ
ncbi:hypothetical protein B7P34_36165 [Streptosporangium nondiastaticum]|uniref:Uncharacterized protein n=1 Tax=Streptosporangium nondiastaticum TaxID=35764 RepID=A0A9X7JI65_9ACTN|nr:hypothetical protein B7P34_36165 [Streptosporangium nondiastaticum]